MINPFPEEERSVKHDRLGDPLQVLSNESQSQDGQSWRPLTQPEKTLVAALLGRGAPLSLPANWLDTTLVSTMADDSMGSLRFKPDDPRCEQRKFHHQHAEIRFRDLDGIEVCAALNLDEQMQPFELDVWKTDFSPLIAIPTAFD